MSLDIIQQTLSRLREDGVPISTCVPDYINDKVGIFGILGNDIIQHFDVFELKFVQHVKKISIANDFVPYGSVNKLKLSVNKFLTINKTMNSVVRDNFSVNISNRFNSLSDNDSDSCSSCRNCLCRFRCAGVRNFTVSAARDDESRSKASRDGDELKNKKSKKKKKKNLSM